MNTFFDQLAAQSGLRIEETNRTPRETPNAPELPATDTDIEIVEWVDPAPPSDAASSAGNPETDRGNPAPSAVIETSAPGDAVPAEALSGEESAAVDSRTLPPSGDPSPVESETLATFESPETRDATTPLEDPVQASLQAVLHWIAAGESSAPQASGSVESFPVRSGDSEDDKAQPVEVDRSRESAPADAETGVFEQGDSLSPDPSPQPVASPSARIQVPPHSVPREETIDPATPDRAPTVTIGSVQITVDSASPTPEPSPRPAPGRTPGVNTSPQPSRSTYLRRHYIIPH